MKKQLFKLGVCLSALVLFVSTVVAWSSEYRAFAFTYLGNYRDVYYDNAPKGNVTVNVGLHDSYNATLGLSLSKKKIFGYSFISRCDKSIYGKFSINCTWNNQGKGSYKGTAVLNTKADGVTTVEGYVFLKG